MLFNGWNVIQRKICCFRVEMSEFTEAEILHILVLFLMLLFGFLILVNRPKTVFYGNTNMFKQEDCVICLHPLKEKQETAYLECQHVFHKKCITKWLSYKNECPICKLELS